MKHDAAYTIAFSVAQDAGDEYSLEQGTATEIWAGLARRIAMLAANPDEILEAVGIPYDSFPMSDEDLKRWQLNTPTMKARG